MLPMVNAPFRLIFAYNPQIFDKYGHGGDSSVRDQGTAPRHQVYDRTQLLIPFCETM